MRSFSCKIRNWSWFEVYVIAWIRSCQVLMSFSTVILIMNIYFCSVPQGSMIPSAIYLRCHLRFFLNSFSLLLGRYPRITNLFHYCVPDISYECSIVCLSYSRFNALSTMVKLFLNNWTNACCISQHVIVDLNLRIQHLSQALQQVLDLESEDIPLTRDVMMATKKHIKMLSKTHAALGRQMHELLGLPL